MHGVIGCRINRTKKDRFFLFLHGLLVPRTTISPCVSRQTSLNVNIVPFPLERRSLIPLLNPFEKPNVWYNNTEIERRGYLYTSDSCAFSSSKNNRTNPSGRSRYRGRGRQHCRNNDRGIVPEKMRRRWK